MLRSRIKTPSPAMVVACLALIVALSGVAYATAMLPRNSVGTAQLKNGAVTSRKVAREGLTLSDLGGPNTPRRDLSVPVSSPITLASDACVNEELAGAAVPPRSKLFGGMVIGTLTNADGGAAVDGSVAVAPTMLIPSSQGGASVNLVVCNANSSPETIPAGSVFHFRLISS